MSQERYIPNQKEKDDIKQAQKVINDGGIILYPSDTIWGLGCNPADQLAVDRIIALKGRNEKAGLIVLIDSERKLQNYVKTIPEVAYDIMDYAEKPTTIIFENGQKVAENVRAKDGSLAIRMARKSFAQALLYPLKCGLVSTSANRSGDDFDGNYSSVPDYIIEEVDYVIGSQRKFEAGNPSSIIHLNNKSGVKIIRK